MASLDRRAVVVAAVAACVIAALVPSFAQTNRSTAPEQPLPYSHKLHVALGLKCQQCHPNPDPGESMTFPATSFCMTCHIAVAKEKPAIQKLSALAVAKKAVPWVRINAVPAGIYWSHRSHLLAGAKCTVCHGEVGQMDVVAKTVDVTTMKGCIACHKQFRASTGCEFCHEGK